MTIYFQMAVAGCNVSSYFSEIAQPNTAYHHRDAQGGVHLHTMKGTGNLFNREIVKPQDNKWTTIQSLLDARLYFIPNKRQKVYDF